jgi:hypothetical protein
VVLVEWYWNEPKLYIYIYSVRTSQRIQCASVRNTTRLMSFRQIIALCCKNHTEHIEACGGKSSHVCSVKRNPAVVLRLWRLKWLCCHSCVGHSNYSSAGIVMIDRNDKDGVVTNDPVFVPSLINTRQSDGTLDRIERWWHMKLGAVSRLCDLAVLSLFCSSLLSGMVVCHLEESVSIRWGENGCSGWNLITKSW